MTTSAALVTGAMLGLSVAVPFGPVSLTCIQRSITVGPTYGMIAGLGAASAHGIFALSAVAGAQAISMQLTVWEQPLRVFSALFVIGLGVRSWLRRPAAPIRPVLVRARGAYASTLLLAMSNPMTILPYAAVASSAALDATPETPFSSWSVPGVMIGAAAWYGLLCLGTSHFCKGISEGMTRRLNQVAGTVLIVIGALLLVR